MAFWNRQAVYDRTQVLEAAEKARGRRRIGKAISEYKKILAVDPDDAHVNSRVAPLLFKKGLKDEAARAFSRAARVFSEKGFADKALAMYVQAATHFPLDDKLWSQAAGISSERGRRGDAVKYLMQGASHLARPKGYRQQAVVLLERALELDPHHLGATLALARVLGRMGRKKDGLARLENLASQLGGPALKQVRAAQFRLSPTPASLWRWLTAGRRKQLPASREK
ncbi:tetratricopeptide repeat protein [Myxococcus stipitatus]|uniref:tetratricopeptide repeat protein n=1 Tax=Myxococcus stipitatus TaxID=83455 RepID=UPI001F370EB0|nr:tetratricopeptide repeat protein [Myxococcus stipitatus]MCE9667051.1 tetratricopeptide repeat protein [Myxococcus stipitatus]